MERIEMSERRFILSSLTGGLPQAGHKKSDPTGNHRSQTPATPLHGTQS